MVWPLGRIMTTAQAQTPEAKLRLESTGRNDVCPCGSGKKYKKCHLRDDESALAPAPSAPDAKAVLLAGWRLFEQRRPGAAEKKFKEALELDADLVDAIVGVGMANLSQGDKDAAVERFDTAIARKADLAASLKADGVTDAFTRPEAQPFIRASHALGCLAYDEGQYEKARTTLANVYEIDNGPVGTEARLVAAKALVKLEQADQGIPLLKAAAEFPTATGRAYMGLALAQLLTGDNAGAKASLASAHEANRYLGRAILGQVRRRVDNPAAAVPGSQEEAVVYAQAFGDVWDEKAKAFLTDFLEGGAEARPEEASEASAAVAP